MDIILYLQIMDTSHSLYEVLLYYIYIYILKCHRYCNVYIGFKIKLYITLRYLSFVSNKEHAFWFQFLNEIRNTGIISETPSAMYALISYLIVTLEG